jgi:hypothetical protein
VAEVTDCKKKKLIYYEEHNQLSQKQTLFEEKEGAVPFTNCKTDCMV